MPPEMKLTKKQQKALQFRGKIEKPTSEGSKKTKAKERTPSDTRNEAATDKISASSEGGKNDAVQHEKFKFEKQKSAAGHAVRFIAFVGNIPFSSTAEDVKVFLKSANPTSVRLMTDKDTGKSRGFAFVEFATSADLRHSLKFHHVRLGSKKVNVELTAGGGGNSENRKQKLKRRRDELEEERKKASTEKRSKKTAPGSENDNNLPENDTDHQYTTQNTSAETEDVADDKQNNDEYDYNDAKTKKPNRRKRGRGSRK